MIVRSLLVLIRFQSKRSLKIRMAGTVRRKKNSFYFFASASACERSRKEGIIVDNGGDVARVKGADLDLLVCVTIRWPVRATVEISSLSFVCPSEAFGCLPTSGATICDCHERTFCYVGISSTGP